MSTKISSANATRVCFSVIYNAECVYISKRERFTYTIYTVYSSSSSSTHSDMLSRFHIHCAFSWTSRSMVSHTNRRAAFGCLEMLVLIFSCDQVSVYERFGPRFVSFIWFAWCVRVPMYFRFKLFEFGKVRMKEIALPLLLLLLLVLCTQSQLYTYSIGVAIRMEPTWFGAVIIKLTLLFTHEKFTLFAWRTEICI